MSVCAIIVAAGRGSRARASPDSQTPKQYELIAGQAVLTRTMRAFLTHSNVDHVQVVIHQDDRQTYEHAIKRDTPAINAPPDSLLPPVVGGTDRQASVRAGLEALTDLKPQIVLIHDAARPFIDPDTITAVLTKARQFDGAVCAIPVSDTLKRSSESQLVLETVPRAHLWRAQTPQGFRYKAILKAHRAAQSNPDVTFTDDAAIAEWANLSVAIVPSTPANEKLTTFEDILMADQRLAQQPIDALPVGQDHPSAETRVGTGFDVHRFGPGDHVWLCGLKIPHDQTLIGHSDADVGLHALTDAILGALGDGDIGDHFPPSDPQWKGARSEIFLKHAAHLVTHRGGKIINVDVTLICEAPKIGPHRQAMRTTVSAILGIESKRISIKATTTEQLGFTGRGEGIAAMASASILLPG